MSTLRRIRNPYVLAQNPNPEPRDPRQKDVVRSAPGRWREPLQTGLICAPARAPPAARAQIFPRRSGPLKSWLTLFFLSSGNARIVLRSQSLRNQRYPYIEGLHARYAPMAFLVRRRRAACAACGDGCSHPCGSQGRRRGRGRAGVAGDGDLYAVAAVPAGALAARSAAAAGQRALARGPRALQLCRARGRREQAQGSPTRGTVVRSSARWLTRRHHDLMRARSRGSTAERREAAGRHRQDVDEARPGLRRHLPDDHRGGHVPREAAGRRRQLFGTGRGDGAWVQRVRADGDGRRACTLGTRRNAAAASSPRRRAWAPCWWSAFRRTGRPSLRSTRRNSAAPPSARMMPLTSTNRGAAPILWLDLPVVL